MRCLSEYLCGIRCVDREEDQLGARCLDSGDLSREVGVGGARVGLNGDYFKSVRLAFGFEGVVKSLAVVVTAVVENCDLLCKTEILDIFCRCGAL